MLVSGLCDAWDCCSHGFIRRMDSDGMQLYGWWSSRLAKPKDQSLMTQIHDALFDNVVAARFGLSAACLGYIDACSDCRQMRPVSLDRYSRDVSVADELPVQ